MKLEFLDDISDGGKYPQVVTGGLIRLYEFDKFQAKNLKEKIAKTIIENKKPLKLAKIDFIETVNCNLSLCLGETDIGITIIDRFNFNCELTESSYLKMIDLLEPFCVENIDGYQWLYETDGSIDFLFSPGGTW